MLSPLAAPAGGWADLGLEKVSGIFPGNGVVFEPAAKGYIYHVMNGDYLQRKTAAMALQRGVPSIFR